MEKRDLQKFQETIQYIFQNQNLLKNALTHSSYANEKNWKYETNNERLEFLGDAVLELISSDFIFQNHANMVEGKMTKLRASLVCESSLASAAREIYLGDYLYLGKGEYHTGGSNRDSILSDAFEALIGAMYLDGGMEAAKKFVHRYVLSDIEKKHLFYDSKTVLQELVQKKGQGNTKINYSILEESGPDHDKCFKVVCEVDEKPYGVGTGRSKKAAEQQAAYETILKIRQENETCI